MPEAESSGVHPRRDIARRVALLVFLIAAIIVAGVYLRPVIARGGALVREQGALGVIVYIALMALVVVVFPLSSLPLLPVAATAWGVLLGGTLSVLGWWIGSLAAFVIARRFGRPVLAKIPWLSRLEEWEKKIPTHATFFSIVLLRLVFPVEIPSYVLGLTKTVRFCPYAVASLIGMTPFAYVMIAMGGAVAAGRWSAVAAIGAAGAVIVYGLYLIWQKQVTR